MLECETLRARSFRFPVMSLLAMASLEIRRAERQRKGANGA
jgi:hypothetical protein